MSAPAAVLYDIHGNLAALQAVLCDARGQGAERFVLGGDYALFGSHPAEAVAALDALAEPVVRIRGNVDRWSADPDSAPADELIAAAIADCRAALGPERVAELGALPEQHAEEGVRFSHASPRSDMESFLPQPSGDETALLAGTPEPVQVFGHTHLQFRRRGPGGVTLINPGSVGMPLDGDVRAAYAILHDDGAIELRRVAYDHEAAAAAMTDCHGSASWAQRTRRRLLSATAAAD